MSGKRMPSRSRLGRAPRDPGDMVKPGLAEPQSPCCKVSRPETAAGSPVAPPTPQLSCGCGNASRGGRVAVSDRKGSNGAPKSPYRPSRAEFGIAYGVRALWRRRPHSSPRPGKPATWRRGPGWPWIRPVEACERTICRDPGIHRIGNDSKPTGEPDAVKAARPVWRGAVGKVLGLEAG
jgi:hypothetical protein